MKMLVAIVNNDDAYQVNTVLSKEGYSATKIASTGGFLMNGNSTFLIGVDDEKVDGVIELIGKYSKKRIQTMPITFGGNMRMISSHPTEITVGGATIFVMDIEKCFKL